jgi:hypothetical protein
MRGVKPSRSVPLWLRLRSVNRRDLQEATALLRMAHFEVLIFGWLFR